MNNKILNKNYLLLFLIVIIVFNANNLHAQKQKSLTINDEQYTKYDNRWLTPSSKLIDAVNLSVVFTIDDEPLFREMSPGNIIDSGYNYGIGVEYVKGVFGSGNGGFYAGAGYEFFPQKYQKFKIIIGYQVEGIFAFLPRIESVYG